jgi:hypothetical protein
MKEDMLKLARIVQSVQQLGYRLEDCGSIPGRGWEFFSLLSSPNWLCDPHSLLPNVYKGYLPGGGGSKTAEALSWPLTSI